MKIIDLENENIRLEPLIERHFNALFSLASHKTLWDYFTKDLSTEDGLRTFINDGIDNAPQRLAFAIFNKESKEYIGSTSFGNISESNKRVEIGWTWLGTTYQGKGFNPQVKRLLLDYVFNELGYVRVEFKTDALNIASRKALMKIGATEEGILRQHTLMHDGRWRDTIYYSILAEEWEEIKRNNPIYK